MRHVFMGLGLFGVWLLWSGHLEPMLLGFGVFSSVFVMFLRARMERYSGVSHEYRLGLRWIRYGPWLVWQITKANWAVARIILKPSLPIQPRLMRIKVSQKSDLAKVIYANSITLTPGTVTLDVQEDQFLVHALTEEAATDLGTGEMDQRVTSMEGKS